jgi:hypothetical protein
MQCECRAGSTDHQIGRRLRLLANALDEALGLEKRNETNDDELRRKGCPYPLRFAPETAFKQKRLSGQSSG